MSVEFLIETGGKIYDISDLVKSVSWADKFNDGCSKLSFSYLDLDDSIRIANGAVVRFKYNGVNIFYGYAFTHEHTPKRDVTVTAYDQLRYGKAKDIIVCKGDTATTLTKKMCNYLNLNVGHLTDTGYKLDTSVQDSKTWLDIVYDAIKDTLRFKGQWYSLRDNFGAVELRNITELETNLVIGDSSLCYDYNLKKSIDEDFYNQIKLSEGNESTGKEDIFIAKDSQSINKYGLLQYYEAATTSNTTSTVTTTETAAGKDKKKKAVNAAQLISKANALLSLYNQETQTLSLNVIGDTSIRAGSSVYVNIEGIEFKNNRLIVKSVTHNYLPCHTMDLEMQL
jgi:hypothetical protein